ncbi:unnamed protein product, partial [Allacma fusca]
SIKDFLECNIRSRLSP